jgi:hypothetical protein
VGLERLFGASHPKERFEPEFVGMKELLNFPGQETMRTTNCLPSILLPLISLTKVASPCNCSAKFFSPKSNYLTSVANRRSVGNSESSKTPEVLERIVEMSVDGNTGRPSQYSNCRSDAEAIVIHLTVFALGRRSERG